MSNYLHEHSRESGKESRKTRGVKRGRKGSERCNMHRETRKQPASSFFFLLLLSLFFFLFFRLPPRPCAFSTRSNFPIQKLRVGRKSRERTLARRFDKFLSYISIHRISILRILIFDIYFILRKKKYVIRFGRGGKEMSDDAFFPSPRRSTTQPFLSSFSPLPSSLPRTLAILNPDFMVPSRGEERLAV